jgi:GNAT superfamily N-acetyltransferase
VTYVNKACSGRRCALCDEFNPIKSLSATGCIIYCPELINIAGFGVGFRSPALHHLQCMEIRESRIGDEIGIAKVRIETWRASYKSIIPSEYLASMREEDSADIWRKRLADPIANQQSFVAVSDAGEVIGFVIGEVPEDESDKCELSGLYVSPSFQGCCVGKQLFIAMNRWFTSRGCRSMFLWTLRDGPAVKFYESQGGQLRADTKVSDFGQPVVQVSYFWPDVARE